MKDVSAYISKYLGDYKPYKTYWNYEDGCVLMGCIQLYRATGEKAYRDFVMDYLWQYVNDKGEIINYETRQYNIDSINCSKALFFAFEETDDKRYRKAIEYTMQRLREHPRTAAGNFWHKELYPQQVWLDGLYMAQPFYMQYEMDFDRMARVADITGQLKTARDLLYNAEKGLCYHACDTAKEQPWANKETGCSPNFWLRSMGWYLMALVDCLGLVSEQIFEHYKAIEVLLKEGIRGILRYQDKESGLFYQVIDHPEAEGNYLETSGSAMVAYALMKGARLGALSDEKYTPIGMRVFESLIERKLLEGEDGRMHLTDICKVAGLGPGEKRDGSVAYYLSEPKCSDDSKGVGPMMMAYAEYMMAKARVDA